MNQGRKERDCGSGARRLWQVRLRQRASRAHSGGPGQECRAREGALGSRATQEKA